MEGEQERLDVEVSVVEASTGQRWAGWFLQVSGVILLLFGGLVTPVWMAASVPFIAEEMDLNDSLGIGVSIDDIIGLGLSIGFGSVVLVVGALMRVAGQMMRGRMDFRSQRELVRWTGLSLGKVVAVVWAIGMLFSVVGAASQESIAGAIACLVMCFFLIWLAGRFHEVRSRYRRIKEER